MKVSVAHYSDALILRVLRPLQLLLLTKVALSTAVVQIKIKFPSTQVLESKAVLSGYHVRFCLSGQWYQLSC